MTAELHAGNPHGKSTRGAIHLRERVFLAHAGNSKTSVHRLLQIFRLKPQHTDSFKLPNDSSFIRKRRDLTIKIDRLGSIRSQSWRVFV